MALFLLFFLLNFPVWEYNASANFIYKSNTNTSIKAKFWFKDEFLMLNPNDKYEYFIKTETNKKRSEISDFIPPFERGVVVVYNNELCDTIEGGDSGVGKGESITGIQNYEAKRINNRNFEFTYIFKEEDYLKADTCE